ncbi:MAG: CapA family protein [Acidimicrobiaceae bacterium]|nr:CapA family protein [Acidimicrobiaceae bacterium]MYE96554.1 CapA family protein [Acidimicrobiaceae bacterium]MYI53653.1 CapA family protein [Acidimicrobiaceae bacterium]
MRSRTAVVWSGALLAAALLASACTESPRVRSSTGASPTLPPETTASVLTTAPITTVRSTTTTSESTRAWTLLAGGDVLMEHSERLGLDPFEFIEPPLGSSDLSVVNVEMAISDRGTPHYKTYVFRAPPPAARRIAAGGVRVANLANNHAMDFGGDALADTIDLLEGAGVATIGAGRNIDEAYRYRILTTGGGVNVAFVGASLVVPSNFAAGSSTPGIASAHPPDLARVLDTVRAAGAAADAVVVIVHWGVEREPCPNDAQRSLSQQLLDAGADAVIGHHPHVLQPVVHTGDKLVAFSLGNFIWEPRQHMSGETGVLQVDFEGDRVVGWAFHPHLLDGDGVPGPAGSGPRVDRIRDIVDEGDCGPYRPPTTTTTTTTTTTSLPPPTGTAGS